MKILFNTIAGSLLIRTGVCADVPHLYSRYVFEKLQCMQSFNKFNFNYLLELHYKSFQIFIKWDSHLLCVLFNLEILAFISSPIPPAPGPYVNSCFANSQLAQWS